MKREEAFSQWIGSQAHENDAGWSEEVWNTAWDSALLEAANRLGLMFHNSDTIQSVSVWLKQMTEE